MRKNIQTLRRFGPCRNRRPGHFHRLAALILVLLLCLPLAGCSLAVPEGDAAAAAGEDRLSGIFITTQSLNLFDMDAWLQDNAGKLTGRDGFAQGEPYEGKLYATLTDTPDGQLVEFSGVEGWLYLCPASLDEEKNWILADDPLNNNLYGAGASVWINEDSSSYEYEATLYFALDRTRPVFYMNPVYCTADGQIYLQAGSGMSFDSDAEGTVTSQSISQTLADTTGSKRSASSVKFTVHYRGQWPAERYRFLQLDTDGGLLDTAEFPADALPDTLELAAGTDCLLIERCYTGTDGGPHTVRAAYNRSEYFVDGSLWEGGSLNYTAEDGRPRIGLMVPREDGTFCLHTLALQESGS